MGSGWTALGGVVGHLFTGSTIHTEEKQDRTEVATKKKVSFVCGCGNKSESISISNDPSMDSAHHNNGLPWKIQEELKCQKEHLLVCK
jgi:hypothetical protein